MIKKFLEHSNNDFEPIKSFYLKENMNPKFWNNFKLKSEIREELLKIANDFMKNLDLEDVKIHEILFCGSLANYNYSKYSDIDVHIVFDFDEINKDNELVFKYLDAERKLWSSQHDIVIEGYQVEVYCENISEFEEEISSGKRMPPFSLLRNKWIGNKPEKSNFVPDEFLIRKKSRVIISDINDIEKDFESNYSYKSLSKRLSKVWKKIKNNRKTGLDKGGELSIENIVFKLLRRNGYIKKILDLKVKIYDKQYSV